MREWIATCVEMHHLCQEGVDQYVPTQLLDVGTESGEREARLVITADEPAIPILPTNRVRYAALSYCWGDASNFPALVTKKRNVVDRVRGIALGIGTGNRRAETGRNSNAA